MFFKKELKFVLFSKRNLRILSKCNLFDSNSTIFRFCTTLTKNDEEKVKKFSAENRTIDRLISALKEGRPYENYLHFSFAPAMAFQYDRCSDFVDIIDEWFSRSRFLIENNRTAVIEIKIASWLIHLGKLNKQTNGAVVKKLGLEKIDNKSINRSPVQLMIRRMIDFGFDDSTYKDLNSALTGIRDLVTIPDDDLNRTSSMRFLLNDWLNSLDRFLIKKYPNIDSISDDDIRKNEELAFVILHGARTTLTLMRQLNICPTPDRQFPILRRLCRLSERGLDFFAAIDRRSIKEKSIIGGEEFGLEELSSFAYVWLFWRFDPERLSEGVWSNFYSCFDRLLSINGKSDRRSMLKIIYFEHALAVAHFFRQSIAFWSIFDQWYRSLGDLLISDIDIDGQELCDLIYSLGLVIDNPKTAIPTKSIDRLPKLIISLIDALIKVDHKSITALAMGRTLCAFSQIEHSLFVKTKRFIDFPPGRFIDYLIDWIDSAVRRKTIDRSLASDHAATFMYFLRKLRIDRLRQSILIDRLILLYAEGIDQIRDQDLTRALFYFGLTCAYYKIDPRRVNIDIWTMWFRQAKRTLISDSNNGRLDKLLLIILSITCTFDLVDDFRELMPLWEKRLIDQKRNIDSRSASEMNYRLRLIKDKYKIDLENRSIVQFLNEKSRETKQ